MPASVRSRGRARGIRGLAARSVVARSHGAAAVNCSVGELRPARTARRRTGRRARAARGSSRRSQTVTSLRAAVAREPALPRYRARRAGAGPLAPEGDGGRRPGLPHRVPECFWRNRREDGRQDWPHRVAERFEFFPAPRSAALDDVLFTGYYQPVIDASPVETSDYRYPVYREPDELRGRRGHGLGRRPDIPATTSTSWAPSGARATRSPGCGTRWTVSSCTSRARVCCG